MKRRIKHTLAFIQTFIVWLFCSDIKQVQANRLNRTWFEIVAIHIASILLLCVMASCVAATETKRTNLVTQEVTEENKLYALGGKLVNRWGVGLVWNGEKSFQHAAVAAGAAATGYFYSVGQRAAEVTAQTVSTNAAVTAQKQAAGEVVVKVAQEKTKVQLAEIAAGASPVTP